MNAKMKATLSVRQAITSYVAVRENRTAQGAFLAIVSLLTILGIRTVVQIVLYKAGFESLTADEFARVLWAAEWARNPSLIWHGVWLPLHVYTLGSALLLYWDMIWLPRIIAGVLGAGSILLMYHLTTKLFHSRRAGVLSALLLSVNPVHIWLSSTPLTEIFHTTLILTTCLTFILYLERNERRYLYCSALALALANGFRFEAWMVSIAWSGYFAVRFFLQLIDKTWSSMSLADLLLAAALPWLVPIAWIAGNYLNSGNPLAFAESIRAYKLLHYGASYSYQNYLAPLLRIDPLATALLAPSLLFVFIRYRCSESVLWFLWISVLPFAIFLYLHGGQIEPPGNFLRYLAPFLFMYYPAIAFLLLRATALLDGVQPVRQLAFGILLLGIVTLQLQRAALFTNDPASGGLKVGLHIQQLQAAQPVQQPVLIELSYWQYFAIHVGSNGAPIIYDRAVDINNRATQSIFLTDMELARACLARFQVSHIVVKSEEVQQVIQDKLGIPPGETVNDYVFYRVPTTLHEVSPSLSAGCPLEPSAG